MTVPSPNRSSVADFSAIVQIATTTGKRETVHFFKPANINTGQLTFPASPALMSLWNWDGFPGASTTGPTSPTACTNATPGALGQTTPTLGYRKILTRFSAFAGIGGWFLVYDRLCHQGGLSGGATGAQTTNLPTAALTRCVDGLGVEPWLEIYSVLGSTQTTATVSYTNDAGVSGRSTADAAIGGASFNTRTQYVILPLASGDRGARAVASVTLAASTGVSGNLGITLAYPLLALNLVGAGASLYMNEKNLLAGAGAIDLGMNSDACLALATSSTLSTSGREYHGGVWFLEVP
jgi:hypothetical protein